MSKRLTILFGVYLMFMFIKPEPLHAQYINVQIDIAAQVDAEVQQPLHFGTLVSNSGIHRIEPGDPDMGIFSVRVLQAQSLLFNLQLPDYLEHNDPENNALIPVSLKAAYTNSGVDDFRSAEPLHPPYTAVVMPLPPDSNHEWVTAYIYLFGGINVTDIPEGTYSAEIILNIEYE